ncbi:MAG: carboxypeptidase-like regulatory domain-containing protein [Bacteroidota bacterium]
MRFILPLFIFLSCGLAAQDYQIKGKIIDAKSNAPIPFVNLGIETKAIGTVSDENGKFTLIFDNLNDEVAISSIGYKRKYITAKKLQSMEVIKLEPVEYNMALIEVVAERFQGDEVQLGVKNKKGRGMSVGFGSQQLGTEIGSVITIKQSTLIQNVNFVLNHAKGDSLFFRMKIYDFQNQKIGQQILKENIFLMEKQRRGTFTIDLKEYDLVLKNDVLLTLEWIKNDGSKSNDGLTFDTAKGKGKKGIYMKPSSQSSLQKVEVHSNKSVCFYFIGRAIE